METQTRQRGMIGRHHVRTGSSGGFHAQSANAVYLPLTMLRRRNLSEAPPLRPSLTGSHTPSPGRTENRYCATHSPRTADVYVGPDRASVSRALQKSPSTPDGRLQKLTEFPLRETCLLENLLQQPAFDVATMHGHRGAIATDRML